MQTLGGRAPRALGRVVAAVAAAAAVGVAAVGVSAQAVNTGASETASATSTASTAQFTVLLADPARRDAAVAAVERAGGRLVRENAAIGALVVEAPSTGFVERISGSDSVFGATRAHVVGATTRAAQPTTGVGATDGSGPAPTRPTVQDPQGPAGFDPLDTRLWGLAMVKADAVRQHQPGDRRVLVGILDSGIDARNPDLAPNFDRLLSRNFVTDIPTDPTGAEYDGPCEVPGCVDPVDRDDLGHGTHVAGTVGAAANGVGLSGVAPNVTLVSIRGGQDAGHFFLQPVVDALTYGADIGLDVINMSFYVDPWLYNCTDNPADSPQARIEQRTTIEAMNRALRYAHDKGVTLVGSLGNSDEDLGRPRTDFLSPNYPPGAAYPREIDNATCFDLPVEGPHVIGVSAVGPSGERAEYSNYGVEQVSVAAPGGAGGSLSDSILSTYPENVLQRDGDVDSGGRLTTQGTAKGVQRECTGSGQTCGYYAYLQGTSMAAPHVTGVAALVVSEHGVPDPRHPGQLTMSPDAVERVLVESATERACPVPAPASAPCEGTSGFNGYYGAGVVDALAAVTREG